MAEPTDGTKAPPQDDKPPMDRFRFRVRRVSDGSELLGPVLEIPKGFGRLGVPCFQGEGFGHGDWAQVAVPAPGLDGKKVRFKLDISTGEQFVPFEEAIGEVVKGWAVAKFRVQHPEHKGKGADAAASEGAGATKLRLSAELV